MKIIITGLGDMSVGIRPLYFEFDYPGLEQILEDNPEFRESTRQTLIKAFTEIEDDKVGVVFKDECPECGKVMGHSHGDIYFCKDKDCISNR